MSEKQEDNVLQFKAKSDITDEEFNMFLDALMGSYKGGGYLPE